MSSAIGAAEQTASPARERRWLSLSVIAVAQLMVALDATIAELAGDPLADIQDRLPELRDQRDPVAATAQNALAGSLTQEDLETLVFVLGRIEAALRARAVASV